MIKTIFLDMDGVMVNFLDGLHRALKAPYQYDPYPYKKGLWNMLNAIRPFDFGGKGPTFEECDACCTQEFWANLKWMHDGRDIFRLVTTVFNPDDIYLMTTCMRNPGTPLGKAQWVEKHIPLFEDRIIILGYDVGKGIFARPDTLLIDDRDKNVKEFTEAGGYGILVNRPWNAGHEKASNTVNDLELDLLSVQAEVDNE
jgi:5'(3')-deoxyribonucleotidase